MEVSRKLSAIQPVVIFRAGIIFYILFSILTIHLPFYGDHVSLISAPANYFFDTGFQSLILPTELDTGHPPFYAVIHAGLWKLFGRNLMVSHLIGLIAILFLFYQFHLFCKKQLTDGQRKIAILLFLLQPTILAQTSLMSADIFVCGLYFSGLNALLTKKTNYLIFAIAVLLLISVRGIIVTGFLLIAVFYFIEDWRSHLKKYFFIFLTGAIPAILWHWFHFAETGWVISNPQSPWAKGREFIGWTNFPVAVFEYFFRYIELGMIVPWLVILFCLKKFLRDPNSKKLCLLIISGFIFFSLFMIFFKNPVMVRYILPVQIMVIILFAKSVSAFFSSNYKIFLLSICSILFIAQHFIAYPQTKSSIFEYSWGEGSLAHLSYFKFRKEGSEFLASHHISSDQVYTGFPEYKSFKNTDLDQANANVYHPFTESAMQTYPFVIYSNIMNGISKTAEMELKEHWIRLETYYEYPVEYIIFQNPSAIKNH